MKAIFKKEFLGYFNSVLGYVVLFFILVIAGFMFGLYFLRTEHTNDFTSFFSIMNTVYLFVMPVLTLRILAEDKKLGTYELLLTSPVSGWEIILGKFLGALLFALISAVLLLFYPLILSFYAPVQWNTVFSGFLGLVFSISFFTAAGMFASSLTDNLVVAGLISLFIVAVLILVMAGSDLVPGAGGAFLKEISYSQHYYQFASGLIRLKDLLYFVLGAYLWLAVSKNVIESRTWK